MLLRSDTETINLNELARALKSNSAFAAPANILQAISDAAAFHKPATNQGSAPHSIYAEVWHMAFWQDVSLDWVEGRPTACPLHASEGFPADFREPWPSVRDRFLRGIEIAAAIAEETSRLETIVACPRTNEPDRVMTIREQLESLAAHNGYHLGRIVLLRQLHGIWPPPDGGESW
jgi:uncharacterized damage-inducible protein DinB